MALFTITNNGLNNRPPNRLGVRNITIDNNTTYTFTLADFTTLTVPTYQDPENDALERLKILVSVTSGTLTLSGVGIGANGEITAAELTNGNFKYVANPSNTTSHTDAFTFDIADTGSSTFSGLFGGNLNITINAAANRPPDEVGDYSTTLDHGESLTFTRAMFTSLTTPVYSDPEGDAEDKLKILSLPTTGTLSFNGINATVNQEINFSDIDSGLLIYNPNPTNTNSHSVTFNFAIADTGSGQFSS